MLKGVRLLGCPLLQVILTGLLSERGFIDAKDVRYRRNEINWFGPYMMRR